MPAIKGQTLQSHLCEVLKEIRCTEVESKRVGVRGCGNGDGELVFNGDRDSGWEDEKGLEMLGGDGCMITSMTDTTGLYTHKRLNGTLVYFTT